jgi:hypothetical protein
LEKLRAQLSRRGVTTSAAALSLTIAANAIYAAPAGLMSTIATAAAMSGAGAVTTTATITKTIAMTTLQKTLITVAAIAAVGTGIHEARQASTWKERAEIAEAQQTTTAKQLEELQHQRDEAVNAQSELQQENRRLTLAAAEAPKLRGELVRARANARPSASSSAGALDPNDPAVQHFMEAKAKADRVAQYLKEMPDKSIPEIQFMDDNDWLAATKSAKFDTEEEVRKTLSNVRSIAKNNVPLGRSLYAFLRDNHGQLPTDMSQLKPYVAKPVTDSSSYQWRGVQSPEDDALVDGILARYKLLHSGNVNNYPTGTWFIVEKAPADKDYDTRLKFAPGTSTSISTGLGEAGDPDDSTY